MTPWVWPRTRSRVGGPGRGAATLHAIGTGDDKFSPIQSKMHARLLLFSLLIVGGSFGPEATAQKTIDLSVVGVRDSAFVRADATHRDTFFNVEGLRFRSVFDTAFGGLWTAGWAFSRSVDTTGGYTNLYGAAGGRRPSGQRSDQTFLVGQQDAYILLPPNSSLSALEYNNLAYTAAVVRRGSSFSQPFGKTATGGTGDPDSLILSVCGYLRGFPTFVRNIALADYRFADDAQDFIVTEWTRATLTPNGKNVETDSVSFRLKSSERGTFGNNTPNFFAIGKLEAFVNVNSVRAVAEVRPVQVFPNPASDFITIGGGGDQARLTIADALGRIVHTDAHYVTGTSIGVAQLAAGHYYVLSQTGAESSAGQFSLR